MKLALNEKGMAAPLCAGPFQRKEKASEPKALASRDEPWIGFVS
ncbi:hypothetical protein [Sphingomicrobium arenosum]|nr:hypothetical protein [Sphingomicrobium arenosum]